MRRFTRLYLELDATTSTNEKADLLASYLGQADPRDAAWVVAIISGERPKGASTSATLRELVEEVTGLPAWLIDECRAAVGDGSETIALLLPEPEPKTQHKHETGVADATPEPPMLHELIDRWVLPLRHLDNDGRKAIIRSAWASLNGDERFVYHKLIRGGFRIGVGGRMLAKAIARLTGLDQGVIAQRLAGRVRPTPEHYLGIISPDEQPETDAAKPYPFFLAHPLEDDPASLGDVTDWIAEWKWDGTRAQLIRRAGQAALWSRGEAVVTHQFPEIISAARAIPDATVLDGEVLLWSGDAKTGRPRPFSELQTRLNRVVAPTTQLALFERDEAVFIAYDLLERGGQDLRAAPQRERRAMLETVLDTLGDDARAAIRLSPTIRAETWDELAERRAGAAARGAEGLMLKHAASPYRDGRVKGDGATPGWYKWKTDPCSVDAVMVVAQLGSGRRASLYTDYTFAVWAGEGEDRALITFAKAYSGLTNSEIERVDKWVRDHTTTRRGPVRVVEPGLVFEIGFEGIRRSPRHKSGVAVRFPRILRWRHDKAPEEADDLARLEALLEERAW